MTTRRTFEHGLDLTAPGALEELFAFHRATFGDAVMRANGGVGVEDDDADDLDADDDDDQDDDAGDDDQGQADKGKGKGDDKGGDDKGGDKGKGADDDKTRLSATLVKERKARREAQAELQRLKNEGASDADKKVNEAVAEVTTKWQKVVARSAARAQLAEAGATTGLDRLVRLIDLDSLEVDDDGTVDGLGVEIDRLKEEMPSLFGEKRRYRDADGGKGGSGGGGSKPKSAADKLAAALSGS